uniref:Large ribosomal subunit protein eL20 n=1 Tax=Chelonoidis abingdonii TaxID=106734 RepID=A0A8C0H642_CHEAB
MEASGTLRVYKVVGRCPSTPKCPTPPLCWMHISLLLIMLLPSPISGTLDLTTAGAVTQCYRGMGARHHARVHPIQIMKTEAIAASKCHRPAVKQCHGSKIKHKPSFTTKRPNTFF